MTLFKRRQLAQKVVIIVIFVVLTTNQFRHFAEFHSQDTVRQPHDDPQRNYDQRSYNKTASINDRKKKADSQKIVVVNEIIHRAFFGLGHRLHRSAAAYHLAQSLSLPQTPISSSNHNPNQDRPTITHFRFHWESCLPDKKSNSSPIADDKAEKEYNVFRYLFGSDVWELSLKDDSLHASSEYSEDTQRSNEVASNGTESQIRRNMIILRNDIPGYIAGQVYKDLKLPVRYKSNGTFSQTDKAKPLMTRRMLSVDQPYEYDIILDKVMRSDVEFYRRLVDNYRFHSELQEFQAKHKWYDRPFVIGLHLRAGNGETAHFSESGRASLLGVDESLMIARLVRLIDMMASRETERLVNEKVQKDGGNAIRPLLFIATDSAYLLPIVEKMTRQSTPNIMDGHGDRFISRSTKTSEPNATTTQTLTVPIDIVTWPQYRLPKNSGVSFDALKGSGDRCLEGWKSSVSDALLLSKVDVLIAAHRSTFSQSLPLTLGFDRNRKSSEMNENETFSSTKNHNHETNRKPEEKGFGKNRRFSFCEVSEPDMVHMTCYMDARSWLFRGEDERFSRRRVDESTKQTRNNRIWSFSISNQTLGVLVRNATRQQVEHKVTTLLPDVDLPNEFDQALQFLKRGNVNMMNSMTRGTETHESIFRYGQSKINKKYRNMPKVPSESNSSWNLIAHTN